MAEHLIPTPRILLGPGPSSVTPRVLAAQSQAPIGYLDPDIFVLIEQIRSRLRALYGTANEFTIPLTGTGMAGMQSCIHNLVEPGDNVAVCVNGFFGKRISEICTRAGAHVTEVNAEWGGPIDPAAVKVALDQIVDCKLVACVHAETSTGILQPLSAIAAMARDAGAIFLADAVTSLGGVPVDMDKTGIDVCYSGTQKCLGAPPGISPISVSERAMQRMAARVAVQADWYFDWRLIREYFDAPHVYHHTVPVNMYFAVNEALQEIEEEGLEPRFERHRAVSAALLEAMHELGIRPFAQEAYRLPTLTTLIVPDSVQDEAAVRRRLLLEYGLEIGGGLGHLKGKIWRVGTMGASATLRNVTLLAGALHNVLRN